MKIQEIKVKGSNYRYSVLIGKDSLNFLAKKIKDVCPKTKKIAIIVDKKIPKKLIKKIQIKLKNYNLLILPFAVSEKKKSINQVNLFLKKLLEKNFNRSDLIISVGGGITGDVAGFVASILKRGVNFINIPTTLLAQVDSAIGGKTGVNSSLGKNLIGSFYQPKLVISDTTFLDSLPKKEMICGYAEILKHSIIKEKKFFNWLKTNTKKILLKKSQELTYAIRKSCQIKIFIVKKDVNEKNLRMILNFGHTFAHAIEAKNKFSKKITHGEAVLSGMILASRLSLIKKVCNLSSVKEIEQIYKDNNLAYTFKKYSNQNSINHLIPFLKNDKKNDDEKINFILLKKIGTTAPPNKFKISIQNLKKMSKSISQY